MVIPTTGASSARPSSNDEKFVPGGGSGAVSTVDPQKIFVLRFVAFSVIATAGLAWDLWTKYTVFEALGQHGVLPIWKGRIGGFSVQFQLETALNHGALWGIGQGMTSLFAAFSFVAVGAIAYFVRQGQATSSKWLTVASGLLLAGTLGNLFDRLGLHRYTDQDGKSIYAVRDFLDFWFCDVFHWATFNFADSYLVVGAMILVLHSFLVAPQECTPALTIPHTNG